MTARVLAVLRHRSLRRPFVSLGLEKRMRRLALNEACKGWGTSLKPIRVSRAPCLRGAAPHSIALHHHAELIEKKTLASALSTCLGQRQSP